ncbi:MAG: zinc-ribbon domain-containing protein [Bacteroidales bacterium]|nr:zinc-ribbon domain-containing protein [Bacteroidales bacterium]
MAFCTHCGAPLPDGARFCTSCGTPITAPTAPQASGPAPVQPVRTTPTPQGGIVIDAPEGATVTISDAPQEHSATAPAEKGEFGAIQWDEPGAPTPTPTPTPAQAPAPATRETAAPAKKKRSFLWWVVVILVGIMYLAMKMNW